MEGAKPLRLRMLLGTLGRAYQHARHDFNGINIAVQIIKLPLDITSKTYYSELPMDHKIHHAGTNVLLVFK